MIMRTLAFGVILHCFFLSSYILSVSAEGDDDSTTSIPTAADCKASLNQATGEMSKTLAPAGCPAQSSSQTSNDKTKDEAKVPLHDLSSLQANEACNFGDLTNEAKAPLTSSLDSYFKSDEAGIKELEGKEKIPAVQKVELATESDPVLQFTQYALSIHHALQERIKSLPMGSKETKEIQKTSGHFMTYLKNLISETNKVKESAVLNGHKRFEAGAATLKTERIAYNLKLGLLLSDKYKYGEELFTVVRKHLSEKDVENQTIYPMIREFETYLTLSAGQDIANLTHRLKNAEDAEKLETSKEVRTEIKDLNEVLRKTLKRSFVKARQKTCYDNEIAYENRQLEKINSEIQSASKSAAESERRVLLKSRATTAVRIAAKKAKRQFVYQILLKQK